MGLHVKCLSIKNWCTDTAVWLGVLSWCRVHPLPNFPGQIPSHFVPLTWQCLNTTCRTHSCPPSTNSWSMMPSLAKNAISKTFKFNLAVWYFFGKGDYVAYHLDDCCLVSGSSIYPTFTSCNNLAWGAVILHWLFKQSTCNCSSIPFDCQHATAEQTLHRPISSIAAHVDPYKIPTSHPTLPMAIHWLAHTSCFIFKLHTRYPLHIHPYRWLYTGWHTPAASSSKLFQHSDLSSSNSYPLLMQSYTADF